MKRKKTVDELERELAEVRQERDQLQAILMEAPVPAGIMQGPDHTTTFVNRAWSEQFHRHAEMGKSFREAFPELVDSPIHAALDAVFGSGEPAECPEVEVLSETGRILMADAYLQPLRDAEGNVTGVAGFGVDATERVATRRQLEFLFEEVRRQAEQLNRWSIEAPERVSRDQNAEQRAERVIAERIIAHAPAGIAYLDRQLAFRWVNPTFRTLFQLPAEGLEGRLLIEAFPLAPSLLGPEMADLLSNGRAFQVRGVPLVTGTGDPETTTYWDVQCHPTPNEQGAIEGVLLFATDVTARLENERLQLAELEALRRADDLKLQLMDMVNYELRAPLHVVMGFGSILRKELAGGLTPRQHDYLAKMLSATDALARVVDEVMTLSQLKTGVFGMFPRPTDFACVIDPALETWRPVIQAQGLQLAVEVAPALPPVFVDPSRISQAIRHLLGNAVKFSPKGGTVRVHVALEDDSLVATIEDAGPGIPASEQARVFEPFAQVNGRDDRPEGVGLGLSIARAIAEAHGGTLTLDPSSAPGARFRLTLPTLDSARYLVGGETTEAERSDAQIR